MFFFFLLFFCVGLSTPFSRPRLRRLDAPRGHLAPSVRVAHVCAAPASTRSAAHARPRHGPSGARRAALRHRAHPARPAAMVAADARRRVPNWRYCPPRRLRARASVRDARHPDAIPATSPTEALHTYDKVRGKKPATNSAAISSCLKREAS